MRAPVVLAKVWGMPTAQVVAKKASTREVCLRRRSFR